MQAAIGMQMGEFPAPHYRLRLGQRNFIEQLETNCARQRNPRGAKLYAWKFCNHFKKGLRQFWIWRNPNLDMGYAVGGFGPRRLFLRQ